MTEPSTSLPAERADNPIHHVTRCGHSAWTRWLTAALASVVLLTVGCETDASGESTTPPAVVAGCAGADLYQNPEDPGVPGPWPVGARTVTIGGLTTEVLYPAPRGSDKGKTRRAYDMRQWLPADQRSLVPEGEAFRQTCQCYGDLPIDAEHGPYPVVVFIHGTAGFRTQSLQQLQHWASRGFIVVAADHPRIVLGDALQLKLGADQPGDARTLLAALRDKHSALDFLGDRADTAQMAVAGHSAGGMACSSLGGEAGVRVAIPMAAGGVDPASPVTSTLVLGGIDDGTVAFKRTREGYVETKGTKRLVGLAKAGHLAFSDLCVVAGDAGDLFSLATQWGIKIPPGTDALFKKLATDGCGADQLDPEEGWKAINTATSAVLEETLQCRPGPDPLTTLQTQHPAVSVFESSP
ncbi:MAG: hypothetical protein KC502_19670 [Myxococcales bacterium]|nr:hypothetical protein [Myxococcales bacterium]